MDDTISRRKAIDAMSEALKRVFTEHRQIAEKCLNALPSAQPEIIRCKDCKHNPNEEWFGCPMAHLSEKQRPDDAWCWKGERRTDEQV